MSLPAPALFRSLHLASIVLLMGGALFAQAPAPQKTTPAPRQQKAAPAKPVSRPMPEAAAKPPVPTGNLLMDTMQQELARAVGELKKAEPAPYYVSYSVAEVDTAAILAGQGAVFNSVSRRARVADIVVRVGSHQLDNTHGDQRFSAVGSTALPLEDDRDAIARTLWLVTDRQYKRAARTFLEVQTNTQVRAQEEDESPDFSKEQPEQHAGAVLRALNVDRAAWEERLRRLSARFRGKADIHSAIVMLVADHQTRYFISTEGARIMTSRPLFRIVIFGSTRAEDGMELLRQESFEAPELSKLPSDEVLAEKADSIAADLKRLRTAPVIEPFNGPALLSGRASAVFFHEVLGHRLEGQRQRGRDEGQTFTKRIDQSILPEFLTVVDDPTVRSVGGVDLSGYYQFDEEGVQARRADLVVNGVLKTFLMSRMPVKGFASSNGHGRAQPGLMPIARQANLIVKSSKTVPDASLRGMLIEEVKRQKKPYGLYFEEIAGGFTLTTRQLPQSFQILPLMVWRVYADGRPDELVRGVDIIGTPISALNRLIVTGETLEVFNGQCGAESGSVPVAAVAPAILFSEIEVQRRAQSHNRPPILLPPAVAEAAPARQAVPAQSGAEVQR